MSSRRNKESQAPDPAVVYDGGWEQSGRANAYLGVNSASTALWLGEEVLAEQLAREVRKLLQDRLAWLTAAPAGEGRLSYWDQVTLAEAKAFTRFDRQTTDIAVTRKQAQRILAHRGEEERADTVLGR